MNPLLKNFVTGIVRHALTYGGGLLTARGWGDSNDWDQVIGALITLAGIAWSIWDKRSRRTEPGAPYNPRAEVRRASRPNRRNGGYVSWDLFGIAVLVTCFWSVVLWLAIQFFPQIR